VNKMAEYFLGRRDVASFVIELERGNKLLQVHVAEYWDLIISDTVRCGAKITLELSRKTGIRKSEKESFENSIGASIGVKSIAEIRALTKENLATEIYWEAIQEEKKTGEYPSPQCGRCDILHYQKLREYHFIYQEKKWFHKNSWQRYLIEHTKYYHDDSKTIKYDPNCPCVPDDTRDYDGLLHIDFGVTSMLAPFRRLASGIEVDLSGKQANIDVTGDRSFQATIPKDFIPESLIFLGNMNEDSYEAEIRPYSEPEIVEESSNHSRFAAAYGDEEEVSY